MTCSPLPAAPICSAPAPFCSPSSRQPCSSALDPACLSFPFSGHCARLRLAFSPCSAQPAISPFPYGPSHHIYPAFPRLKSHPFNPAINILLLYSGLLTSLCSALWFTSQALTLRKMKITTCLVLWESYEYYGFLQYNIYNNLTQYCCYDSATVSIQRILLLLCFCFFLGLIILQHRLGMRSQLVSFQYHIQWAR